MPKKGVGLRGLNSTKAPEDSRPRSKTLAIPCGALVPNIWAMRAMERSRCFQSFQSAPKYESKFFRLPDSMSHPLFTPKLDDCWDTWALSTRLGNPQ